MIGFLFRRMLAILVTLIAVTMVLYALVMLVSPEDRASLYFPNTSAHLTDEAVQRMINQIIERYQLDEPYWVQYGSWVSRLVVGEWGYSPSASMNVLDALLQRTPASLELILYSLIFLIPLGIISGLHAGSRHGQRADYRFRFIAFTAASLPPFILGMVLLSIFWVGLHWFSVGRLSMAQSFEVTSSEFRTFTGLITIDGLLNARPDISLDALRHLVLPVITLSLAHWATLGRITRAATIEELGKDYVLAARGRGIPERGVIWSHTLRNVLVPALNSSALAAASLFTSLFVVEVIFLYNGVSSLLIQSMRDIPDVGLAIGFAVYSILAVLTIMVVLDILQAIVDPRIRTASKNL